MNDPDQLLLRRKYELDRAHEVELNKFTHSFEMERAKLLFVLNGASFTVLLALVEVGGARDIELLKKAALCWIGGLFLAVVAGQLALEAQREFTKAYHNRRRAIETGFGIHDVIKDDGSPVTGIELLQRSSDAREKGKGRAMWAPIVAFAGVISWVVGAIVALRWINTLAPLITD